ncbi:MAG TPA: M15 family metallopeptidase [Reyranella sp.]|nr:M15 family metallopeptidase [Reyranella sp.]
MGLPMNARTPAYGPPAQGNNPTLLGANPGVVPVANPTANDRSSSPPATQERTAVVRNLPGWGETFLDSEFAPKVDAFIENARAKGDLNFSSAYRSQAKQDWMRDHPREAGVVYPPAKQSLHSAGMAVDVDMGQDPKRREAITDAATRAGLTWGGTFSPPDDVHFQFMPPAAAGTDLGTLIRNFDDRVRTLQTPRMTEPI